MKARLAMTREVVCVAPDDSLIDVHRIMTEWKIRHLPVLVGGALVGILSDRDVLLHAKQTEDGIDVPNLPVSEVMTSNPITCSANADVTRIAMAMLEHSIDSVPVVDEGGRLVGLVTSSDLLQILVDKDAVAARLPLPFQWKVLVGMRPGMAAALA